MAAPGISQGTLNRLRGSIILPDFPQLTVTAPFLGKRMISLAFQGESTVYLDTATGAVTSPEPYLRVAMQVHLVKSVSLAQLYKTQLELMSLLGRAIVRPDTAAMLPYFIDNCAIQGVGDQTFDGSDPVYLIRLGGVYTVNGALYL